MERSIQTKDNLHDRKGKFDYVVKMLIIGNSGVGKSCIVLRYVDDSFTPSFISTIGIDFKIKTVLIDGKKVKLMIWDTAGQERFRTITTAYYRGAMGLLLVYDITNTESFEAIKQWMNTIDDEGYSDIPKIIVGNKSDKTSRVVSKEMGESIAKEYGAEFYETSAKIDQNVSVAFEELVKNIIKNADKTQLAPKPHKLDKIDPTVDKVNEPFFKKWCTIL
jgi:Ras-related protein Rab-8A